MVQVTQRFRNISIRSWPQMVPRGPESWGEQGHLFLLSVQLDSMTRCMYFMDFSWSYYIYEDTDSSTIWIVGHAHIKIQYHYYCSYGFKT